MTEHIVSNVIPQPPQLPLVRNLFSFDRHAPIKALTELAEKYGEIFSLDLMGKHMIVVSSVRLANELCDHRRFDKSLHGTLGNARRFVGDGLFTATTDEPNWRKAHNVLLSSFSQSAMRDYHPMMVDIASQLILKWSRLNRDDEVDVARDMTALTLDTIGLCGFGYRFNSFYRERSHPFVEAMVGALNTTKQTRGLPGEQLLCWRRERQLDADIQTMNELVDQIIWDRKNQRDVITDAPDLLGSMLAGVDKDSGERLDDVNIRYQIITFLIAGHETTSGLLSFAIYYLSKHPAVLNRCYEEIDRVIGYDRATPPTYEQVNQLVYVPQVLKETLRLSPTAPAFGVTPRKDTFLDNRFPIEVGTHIALLLPLIHRDKTVWGERAEDFDPDNFTSEAEAARPPNCFKPFGNGQRACIGQQFAMHEATLVLAMVLQNFELIGDPTYQLKIKETLTLKPEQLRIKVRQRKLLDSPLEAVSAQRQEVEISPSATPVDIVSHSTPMLVLFGSNMGTAEERARQIAREGANRGFVITIGPLDNFVERLPSDGPVVIVTASYNGNPPDNAANFCEWLRARHGAGSDASTVRYSVFGCGNRDWTATYQAIPRLIDERLAALGATRLEDLGQGDAKGDFDGQFSAWSARLWSQIAKSFALELGQTEKSDELGKFSVEIVPDRSTTLLPAAAPAKTMIVWSNRELRNEPHDAPVHRSTRHIEIDLPEHVTYQAGDHLAVVPRNDGSFVQRVAARFGLDGDTIVQLHQTQPDHSFFPIGERISVYRLLAEYPEVQQAATRRQIEVLARFTQCPDSKRKLQALASDVADSTGLYETYVLKEHRSVFDLLEEFPACALPFDRYLDLLSPLTPRYYSISSSPLQSPRRCSLTVSVVNAPARKGRGVFKGVCSNYLAHCCEGQVLWGFVRNNGSNFRLPDDPSVPIIMIGAGTGLAPFRGFLQERAAQAARGATLGPAILFFGCQHPDRDYLYKDELCEFVNQGIVEVHTAFSRVSRNKKTYVQHKVTDWKDDVWALTERGARIYVCGDASGMAAEVRNAFIAIHQSKTGTDTMVSQQWLDAMTASGRYLVDIWAAT